MNIFRNTQKIFNDNVNGGFEVSIAKTFAMIPSGLGHVIDSIFNTENHEKHQGVVSQKLRTPFVYLGYGIGFVLHKICQIPSLIWLGFIGEFIETTLSGFLVIPQIILDAVFTGIGDFVDGVRSLAFGKEKETLPKKEEEQKQQKEEEPLSLIQKIERYTGPAIKKVKFTEDPNKPASWRERSLVLTKSAISFLKKDGKTIHAKFCTEDSLVIDSLGVYAGSCIGLKKIIDAIEAKQPKPNLGVPPEQNATTPPTAGPATARPTPARVASVNVYPIWMQQGEAPLNRSVTVFKVLNNYEDVPPRKVVLLDAAGVELMTIEPKNDYENIAQTACKEIDARNGNDNVRPPIEPQRMRLVE